MSFTYLLKKLKQQDVYNLEAFADGLIYDGYEQLNKKIQRKLGSKMQHHFEADELAFIFLRRALSELTRNTSTA